MLRKALMWLVAATLLVCAPITAQTFSDAVRVYDPVEVIPTPFHYTIHQMVMGCTGLYADYNEIVWWTASMILIGDPDDNRRWNGMWTERHGYPEITLKRDKIFDGYAVSHELLHNLYKGTVPMDVANRCLLEWKNMQHITPEEETPPNDPN